jgi:hypothetical protein
MNIPDFFFILALKIIFFLMGFYTDISCLGGAFAKNTSREMKKFPEPKGEGNLVSRLIFFTNTPPKHDISV